MGRAPCCDKANVKKGPWSPEEDNKLKHYIQNHGTGGNWISLPQKAGLRRCGKSCRLRWLNYLRPNIKHGEFSDDEDAIIYTLFASIGSRWSIMAAHLPGRTDNDIKNYWNTKLKKKLINLISTNTTTSQFIKPHHNHLQSFTSHPLILQSQNHEYINVNPMQTYNQVKDSSTLLMFTDHDHEASCTTSNSVGICHDNMGRNLQSSSCKGVDGNYEKVKGCYGDSSSSSLESNLEEFKKLISTDFSSSNLNDDLNLLLDEIKTEEKVMYYY